MLLTKNSPPSKKTRKWLKENNSQSLQSAIIHLENSFKNFFKGKRGFPKFKSKRNPVQSFSVPQHYKIDFYANKIYLPKVGWIKTKIHRQFEGIQKTATVSMTDTGKYYISILVDDGLKVPDKERFNEFSTVGLDLGITHFLTTSNGQKVDNPRFLNLYLRKLKREQRRLSRKKKGSKNRYKQRLKVSKIHEKIKNIRHDFHHKLSFNLICENQAICLEKLNIQGMMKNHYLAQSISDVGWYNFLTNLQYKAGWYGKTILQIDRFDPSSKKCNNCGYHYTDLKLRDRIWKCPECGTFHDRDVNAVKNIKISGLCTAGTAGILSFSDSIS